MKKVLVVHFSQTGQLNRVVEQVTAPLLADPNIEVTFEALKPVTPYPFPWPFLHFLDHFPECAYDDPDPQQPYTLQGDERFDLVILAYQVWYLSPSLPTTAFLQSEVAASVLRDTPVVTLIACRNMWLMAQERVKQRLADLNAKLVGNIALTDEAGSALSFVATPIWMLTGNKGPYLKGRIPKAGVSESEIAASRRFGERICERLEQNQPLEEDLLRGLQAVTINPGLISGERAGQRAFRVWGKLIRAIGPRHSRRRKPVLALYSVFLITLILTVIPIGALLKKALAPLTKNKIAAQRAYFSAPSGEE